MRRSVTCAMAVCLAMAASAVMGQSTEPSKLLRIFREDIKSGKGAAHEKTEAAYVRAFSKSKYPNYLGLDSITGPSQAWFLERHESYESLGDAMQLSQAEPLKGALAQLDALDGELRSGERSMIATYRKELSYLPVPSNMPMMRFVNINTIRVRLGHNAEFAEMRKLANASFEKSGNKLRRVVYGVVSGAPLGTYIILSGMESLKAMDPVTPVMSMAESFGQENMARYLKLASDIVMSNETVLFAVNPKTSYPPKEFVSANPTFWTPAPKPAAAAKGATPGGN